MAPHACERAFSAGVYVTAAAVCAGQKCGLSDTLRYQDALGDEPDLQAKLSFREIHQTMPPPAFTDLWLAELAELEQERATLEQREIAIQQQALVP